jgi:hypothetical protein
MINGRYTPGSCPNEACRICRGNRVEFATEAISRGAVLVRVAPFG